MLYRLSRIGLVLLIGLLVLLLTNPSEEDFLNKVSLDYGALHGGMRFSNDDLLRMGESHRKNYLFFSTYQYEFGTIGVRYIGFASSTFQVESFRKEGEERAVDDDVVA